MCTCSMGCGSNVMADRSVWPDACRCSCHEVRPIASTDGNPPVAQDDNGGSVPPSEEVA